MTGSGTLLDPYIIQDVDDLQAMEDDLDAYYELASNIDASATSGWNSGLGFNPIGQAADFTGQLDGKGFVLSSLFINRDDAAAALFNVNDGAVQDLGLISLDTTGASIAGMVYKNTGSFSKCFVTGAVKIGTLGGFAGGFVQWNQGSISNCFSRCSVAGQGASYAAGFVQWNNGGTIDDCYCTGAVSGATFNAGFCQSNDNPTDITNCFWDTQTSGQAASDGGTGKTTAQMKTQSTFTDAGWNFSTIWGIDGVNNNGYPFFIFSELTGRFAVVETGWRYIDKYGTERYIIGTPVT